MKLASFRTVRDGAVGVMPRNEISNLAASAPAPGLPYDTSHSTLDLLVRSGREPGWFPKSDDAVEIEIGRAGVSHEFVR